MKRLIGSKTVIFFYGALLLGCSQKTISPEPSKNSLTQEEACAFLLDETHVSEGKIWQKRAQCDLIAGHKTMLASHPGPVDPLNPGFMKTANAALQNALSLAQNIKTPAGYQSVMDAYTAAFKDGHFQLITTKKLWDLPTGTGGFKWAGILIGWRADTFTAVYTHETSGVKQGDELVSCDGIKAADMMHENVFPYSHYSDNNPNSWAMLSRHLLADNGNPLIKTPQNCLFSGAKGEYKVVLNWQARPKNYWDIAPKALFGATPKTGMKEIKPGIWWVNAANFSPQNDAQLKANKDMIADIKAKQSELRSARAIVFDTRGNNGGSSLWGQNILTALYGEDYYSYKTYRPEIKIDYRISKTNLDYIKKLREDIGVKQNNQQIIDWIDSMLPGLQTAFDKGENFYTTANDEEDAPAKTDNPVAAKVYLFTHGWCASACLDFADDVYAMEGSTHIGYPTSSDSPYMEVRHAPLPSGYSDMVVPIKVWRNRPRGDGEYYAPKRIYNSYDWSDEGVQNWFLNDVFKEEKTP